MSFKRQAHLEDILESISKIEAYKADASLDDLLGDPLRTDALALNLLVIGKAVGHILQDLRDHHLNIPWRQIVGLRNIITHQYFRFDLEIIWDVIENELDTLKLAVQDLQDRTES